MDIEQMISDRLGELLKTINSEPDPEATLRGFKWFALGMLMRANEPSA